MQIATWLSFFKGFLLECKLKAHNMNLIFAMNTENCSDKKFNFRPWNLYLFPQNYNFQIEVLNSR